jgi:hypothetical protein
MADLKISQLTGATTPLAGTEVLPIVQSSSTKKVATDDLTVKNIRSNATNGILQVAGPAAAATRTMTVPDANFTAARTDAANSFTGDQTLSTGNLIIGTSGKGIDFSATPGTGTSELLADYEEGSWTPIAVFSGGNGTLTYGNQAGLYTRVGRVVHLTCRFGIVKGTASGDFVIGGLPFTIGNGQGYYGGAAIGSVIRIGKVGNVVTIRPVINTTTADVFLTPFESLTSSVALTNVDIDAGATGGNSDLFFSMTYFV